jgi:hypothetical protein
MSSKRATVFICDRCQRPGRRAGCVLLGNSIEGAAAGENGRWELCFPCMDHARRLREEKHARDPSAWTAVKQEGSGQ